MKSRMNMLDIRVQVHQLQKTLKYARVANVYDINSRNYLFKFTVPPRYYDDEDTSYKNPTTQSENTLLSMRNETDANEDVIDVDDLGQDSDEELFDENPQDNIRSQQGESLQKNDEQSQLQSTLGNNYTKKCWKRILLLVESGARIHTTNYVRDKGNIPSGFSIKLRKHLRTRRLEHIKQLGSDRVIEMGFSVAGQIVARIICEFYAAGNIILTDENYYILALLRTYRNPDLGVNIAVKEKYPVDASHEIDGITQSSVISALEKCQDKDMVRKSISSHLFLPPQLIQHALLAVDLPENIKVAALKNSASSIKALVDQLQILSELLIDPSSNNLKLGGYIIGTEADSATQIADQDQSSSNLSPNQYREFSPYLLAQYVNSPYKYYPTFDEACDEFFASLETRRKDELKEKKEKNATKKLDKLKQDLDDRIKELESSGLLNMRKAGLIEENQTDVEAAILIIRSAIASGLDWAELAHTIKLEKRNGNPIAQIIHSLHLERNEVTLMLASDKVASLEGTEQEIQHSKSDSSDDDDNELFSKSQEEDQSKTTMLVDVDLSQTAYSNARIYYEKRKTALSKQEKTIEVSKKAVKQAEIKAKQELKNVEISSAVSSIREIRKTYWFEKFSWFISSENYIVVAGKDAQQNELLVKRHLRSHDVYVHADIHGAASVVIKNNAKDGKIREVPPLTLSQAGCFAMCRSSAWDSKIVTSAWWVRAHQVSKTAPSGEYLSTGSFIIRGKKNFLPPAQLVMGYGMLFKIDETCLSKHLNERAVRGNEENLVASNAEEIQKVEAGEEEYTVLKSGEDIKETGIWRDNYVGEVVLGELSKGFLSAEISTDANEHVDQNNAKIENEASEKTSEEVLFEKYSQDQNLEFLAKEKDDDQASHTVQDRGKKLSARERRDKKKNKTSDSGPSHTEGPKIDQAKNQNRFTNIPRGKKSKLKKMKDKYAEQDEDERELAMALLGAAKIKEELKEEAAAETESHNKRVDEDVENSENKESKTTKRFMNKKQMKLEKSEIEQVLEQEGIRFASEENEALNELDYLTGDPKEDDILYFAIPVCAPYSALSSYKYKAKLMPGSLKRGKAYKQIEALFLNQADKEGLPRQKDLIRAIPQNEALGSILGNTRVQAPGIQNVKTKNGKK